MFRVTTVNLTRDQRQARPDLGRADLGLLDAGQLLVLLENFRQIDAVQNHDASPEILIESPRGKYQVLAAENGLRFAALDTPRSNATELSAAEIVQQLETSSPHDRADVAARRKGKTFRVTMSVVIIGASVALNWMTLRRFFHVDPVEVQPPVAPVADRGELIGLGESALGRYATGADPGDRAMEILGHDRVRFLEIRSTGERVDSVDSFRIGRRDSAVCLVTTRGEVIEVNNIDTLVFSHDVYRRTK